MRVVYVILHYMAGKDTIECVNSILQSTRKSEHNTFIVIIDNGSKNNSYREIIDVYKEQEKVIVIHNDENLGFSKGNNIGFKYAKQQLKADFIVQLNNDTLITQNNFNEILIKKYYEKEYYVLGPDIITRDGYHQNPGSKQSWTLNELRFYRFKKRIRIILSYIYMDTIISNSIKKMKDVYRTQKLEGDLEDTILHGACWIFSPLYIEKFDGLYDKTFLYMEEDILKLFADYYGFKIMYSGELSIYHKEDIATDMFYGSMNNKMRSKYKWLIHSSLVYSNLKKTMLNNRDNCRFW